MNLTNNETENIYNIVNDIASKVKILKSPEQLANEISDDIEIVLLGECTHGTKEFYDIRSEMTKELILNKGFNIILLEAEWTDIYRVNNYILNKNNDKTAEEALSNINKFPQWMWRNKVAVDLIEWLRKYNIIMSERNKPQAYIFGMDCQQIYKSYKDLLDFLKKYDPSYYMYIIRLLSFFKQFNNESEYSQAISNGKLKKYIEIIPTILQDLLSSYQWDKVEEYIKHSKELDIDLIDIISSEQNVEILVNAEEYFRKMVLEPPGSQASWNTRDQHMLMTIMRMRNRFQQISKDDKIPKIIVWAHNSHIGNSDATNRGGKDFTHNNTWNVGQMVKETFPKSKVIGFYTDNGTVTANSCDNSIICKSYKLIPASYYSYEYFFHKVSTRIGINNFYIDMSPYKNTPDYTMNLSYIKLYELNIEYRTICRGSKITANAELDSEVIVDNLDEGFTFIATERITCKYGSTRLKIENGGWITEFIPRASTSLYCLPVNTLFYNELEKFFNSNLMQRWIGVTYCKDTEIQSHYGNSCLAKQYDYVVFVDRTYAIESIDI